MTRIVSVGKDSIILEGYEASEVLGILVGLQQAQTPSFGTLINDYVKLVEHAKVSGLYDRADYEDGVSTT